MKEIKYDLYDGDLFCQRTLFMMPTTEAECWFLEGGMSSVAPGACCELVVHRGTAKGAYITSEGEREATFGLFNDDGVFYIGFILDAQPNLLYQVINHDGQVAVVANEVRPASNVLSTVQAPATQFEQ